MMLILFSLEDLDLYGVGEITGNQEKLRTISTHLEIMTQQTKVFFNQRKEKKICH